MKNVDLARRFADAHLDLEFDAVVIDATVVGGRIHGEIHLDKTNRFLGGNKLRTSSIQAVEAGGRLLVTRNTRYLVQGRPETEQARREAANENAEPAYMFVGDPAMLEVDAAALNAHFDQALDALVESDQPDLPVEPPLPPLPASTVDPLDLESRAYRLAVKHVDNFDGIYDPARRAILAALVEALGQ